MWFKLRSAQCFTMYKFPFAYLWLVPIQGFLLFYCGKAENRIQQFPPLILFSNPTERKKGESEKKKFLWRRPFFGWPSTAAAGQQETWFQGFFLSSVFGILLCFYSFVEFFFFLPRVKNTERMSAGNWQNVIKEGDLGLTLTSSEKPSFDSWMCCCHPGIDH